MRLATLSSTALVLAACHATARHASAQEEQPLTAPEATPLEESSGVRTHDGFYLRLGIGLGYGTGEVRPNGSSSELSVSGTALAVELSVGGTPAPGLVLGVGSFGAGLPKTTYEQGGFEADAGQLILSSIGPFVDWYVDPHGGGHVQAGIAYAVGQQEKGDDLPENYAGSGFALMAGAGYEFWTGEQWGVGVLGRIQYFKGTGTGDDPSLGFEYDFSMLVPAILFSATHH
jgi:hypothetical protein